MNYTKKLYIKEVRHISMESFTGKKDERMERRQEAK